MKLKAVHCFWLTILIGGCHTPGKFNQAINSPHAAEIQNDFPYDAGTVNEIGLLRYEIPPDDWNILSSNERVYAYYLVQAAMCGRDIFQDQMHVHNLEIRNAIEGIYREEKNLDIETTQQLKRYLHHFWFSSSLFDFFTGKKIQPEFSKEWLALKVEEYGLRLSAEVLDYLYSPTPPEPAFDDPHLDEFQNFYGPNITKEEVLQFYDSLAADPEQSFQRGLTSRLYKDEKGVLKEDHYSALGLYAPAFRTMAYWIEKAIAVTESEHQKAYLEKLVAYLQTGDINKYNDYVIEWLKAPSEQIDFLPIFYFAEMDQLYKKASFDAIITLKNSLSSNKTNLITEHLSWFKDNLPMNPIHVAETAAEPLEFKSVNALHINGLSEAQTALSVAVSGEEWVEELYGVKAYILANIESSRNIYSNGGFAAEFFIDEDDVLRQLTHSKEVQVVDLAIRSMVGLNLSHVKIEEGNDPQKQLKEYFGAVERAKSYLLGAYFMLDEQLVEKGVLSSKEAGQIGVLNSLTQSLLTNFSGLTDETEIKVYAENVANWLSHWVLSRDTDNSIVRLQKVRGKTYVIISDYKALKSLLGNLAGELQAILYNGNYELAKDIITSNSIVPSAELLAEVTERMTQIDYPAGLMQLSPLFVPQISEDGEVLDVAISYEQSYEEYMLYQSEHFGCLKHGVR